MVFTRDNEYVGTLLYTDGRTVVFFHADLRREICLHIHKLVIVCPD